jgi:hypothetical protein
MKKKCSDFGRTHVQGHFHHGSEVQQNNSMLICGNVVKITSHSDCAAIFHTCTSQGMVQHYGPHIIYIYYRRGFNNACCDCKCCSLIWIKRYIPLTKFFRHSVFISNCLHMHNFHRVKPLITKYVIRMTTTLNTSTQRKPLSVHEKLDTIKVADVP